MNEENGGLDFYGNQMLVFCDRVILKRRIISYYTMK